MVCPGNRFRALSAEGPATISGRVQFSARQQKEFMIAAAIVAIMPWNLHRAEQWLREIEANRKGFSPTWVPPAISWVVSGDPISRHPVLPVMPRALPSATPVPVAMEDVTKRRVTKKRMETHRSDVLAPAARRLKTSQRDQNLAAPSAAQSVCLLSTSPSPRD